MDLEDRRGGGSGGAGGGPLKMARTDSFHRQSDLKMHMNGSPSGTMVLSSSMVSDGRLGCSPTNSCASDGSLLGNDHGNVVSDARLLRQDSLVSASAYSGGGAQGGARGPLSYHHLQSSAYHFKPSGKKLLVFLIVTATLLTLSTGSVEPTPKFRTVLLKFRAPCSRFVTIFTDTDRYPSAKMTLPLVKFVF